jgi:hypothetical protein
MKGEAPLELQKEICETCRQASPGQARSLETYNSEDFCRYKGKKEADLPAYLRGRS